MGVGENGSAEDADVLVEYLYADRPRLVKNALKALSTLRVVKIGKVYLADVYWKHLNASDTSVAKAAYQAICKSDISYGAGRLYQALAGCTDDNTRKYLVRLLVKEPSWERLPYLLLLYEPGSWTAEALQIRRAVCFRSVYARITRKWADFIMETMEQRKDKIPDGLRKEIIFDLEHITMIP